MAIDPISGRAALSSIAGLFIPDPNDTAANTNAFNALLHSKKVSDASVSPIQLDPKGVLAASASLMQVNTMGELAASVSNKVLGGINTLTTKMG